MRVIVAGVKKGDVRKRFMSTEADELARVVGGPAQPVAPIEVREMGIEMLVNEMGLFCGNETNENIFPYFFVGTVIFVGTRNGKYQSLTMEQCRWVRDWLERMGEEA